MKKIITSFVHVVNNNKWLSLSIAILALVFGFVVDVPTALVSVFFVLYMAIFSRLWSRIDISDTFWRFVFKSFFAGGLVFLSGGFLSLIAELLVTTSLYDFICKVACVLGALGLGLVGLILVIVFAYLIIRVFVLLFDGMEPD